MIDKQTTETQWLNSPGIAILWIDDSVDDVELMGRQLRRESSGQRIGWRQVETAEQMQRALSDGRAYDVALCDCRMPDFDPDRALRQLEEAGLEIPLIIVSGEVGEKEAVRLMTAGAKDFVSKDSLSRLHTAIMRVLSEAAMLEEKRRAQASLVRMNVVMAERNRQLEEALRTEKELRDELARAQRLRLLGEMSSGVAHDFNNSLTKILGFGKLVKVDLEKVGGDGELREQLSGNMEQILEAADDASHVVKRLSGFYQREMENPISLVVDLDEAVSVTIERGLPKWGDSGVELEMCLGGVGYACGESSELREVLTNVIFNAIDATEAGGQVKVETRVESNLVVCEVADNGCGMSEDVLAQCLQPFFTTKGNEGTGLGLSLADGILRQFGGRVEVSSVEGEGTVVSLWLKVAGVDDAKAAVARDAVAAGAAGADQAPKRISGVSPMKVLVVDDEPLIGMLMRRYLEAAGHEVELVESGGEALERLAEVEYTAVFSDRTMPGIDGDQLARTMKEQGTSARFVMMSGLADLMLAKDELPFGVEFLLRKPIEEPTLRDVLEDIALAR